MSGPNTYRCSPNLVPLAGLEPDFDEGRLRKPFHHPVVGDGIEPFRVVTPGLLLYRSAFVPDQPVAPRPRGGIRAAIDHGPVDPFRLAASELFFELALRARMLGEDHQSRRITIDPVHDQRTLRADPPHMVLDLFEDRRRRLTDVERHRQKSRRLVEDDQVVVFEDDAKRAPANGIGAAPGGARPIGPHADVVAGGDAGRTVRGGAFDAVDEDASALQRGDDAAA